MRTSKLIWLLPIALTVFSCAKEESDDPISIPVSDLKIDVYNEIDGAKLVYNNLEDKAYANAAGNIYEVTRCEYYLSDFKFLKSNGQWHKPKTMPVLINGENQIQSFTLSGVQQGDYVGISFMIGIPADQNVFGFLENTLDNINMQWPESLRGGYHYMKFEGNYYDNTQTVRGFTVHLGDTDFQSVNTIENISIKIASSDNLLPLAMNLNEWFQTPHLFDFNVDGNYTMAVDSLMEKVSENGRDCFTIKTGL